MKALIVIDMLVDFISPDGVLYIGPAAEDVLAEVRKRLDKHRLEKNTVIYICDRHLEGDREFEMFPSHCLGGSAGSEVVSELKPQPGEQVIYKRRYSGFFGTDLDLSLREKGITELELVGVVTNICILYTAASARMLNYKVSVPTFAVASFDHDAHRFALQEMEKTLGVNLI